MKERLMTAAEARGVLPDLAKHLAVSPGNAEEIVADLIRLGEESADMLRLRQECPVCQIGTVEDKAVSCGVDYRCNNPECSAAFTISQVRVPRPEFPDTVEDSLKFGWGVSQERGRLAKRQSERAQVRRNKKRIF